MKLKIQRSDFIKWWQFAERITNPRNSIASLGGVLCTVTESGVVLEATDLKTSVRCVAQGVSADAKGAVILPAKLLGELFKRVPTDEFSLEFSGEKGTLIAGKNKTKFTTWPTSDFPKIPLAKDAEIFCELSAGELLRVVTEGSTAGNQGESFPTYIGTCLFLLNSNVLRIVSTDSHRLALADTDCIAEKDAEFVLPILPVRELLRLLSNIIPEAKVRILTDGSVSWFQMGEIEFSIRRVEASFPGYERILTPQNATSVVVNLGKITAAFDRVEVIVRDSNRVVIMKMSPGGDIRLSGKSPTTGTAVEYVEATITGEPAKLGFNIVYIQDGIKAFSGPDIELNFDGTSGQITMTAPNRKNFMYMTMPVSISGEDDIEEEDANS